MNIQFGRTTSIGGHTNSGQQERLSLVTEILDTDKQIAIIRWTLLKNEPTSRGPVWVISHSGERLTEIVRWVGYQLHINGYYKGNAFWGDLLCWRLGSSQEEGYFKYINTGMQSHTLVRFSAKSYKTTNPELLAKNIQNLAGWNSEETVNNDILIKTFMPTT